MSKKKLAGIIAACAVAIIVAIVLIHFEPWAGTSPAETYLLTAYVSPLGAGFVSPSGGEYEFGEQVTLTASPASGYTFDHWSGGASGNSANITITMNHKYPITIIANFAPIVVNPLTLLSPASGATEAPNRNIGFAWTRVDGADGYYFVLSANSDLSVPIVEVTRVSVTAYTYTGREMEYDTAYYWQVKALNGGSVSSESTIGVFLTMPWCCP
jgi:uncharacterized repeat protein (TIGR02543 family)